MDGTNTLDAVWCIDSEDPKGGWYLLDRKTGQVLARKDSNGNIIDPGAKC